MSLTDTALPDGWEWVPLKYLTTVLRRGTTPNYVDDGPVRVVGQAANQADGLDWGRTRFHAYQGDPSKLKGYLQPGDVLINSTGRGTLGRVGYFVGGPDGAPCMADTHITIARADTDRWYSRFAYYYLSSDLFYEYIYSALVVGATNQIELSNDRLAGAPAVLPGLEEQRRIADFLDAETARIGMLAHYRARQMQLLSLRSSSWTSQVYSYLSSKNPVIRLRRVLSLIEQGWSPECENRPAGPEEWGVLKAGCVNGGRFRREEQKALPKDLEPKIQYQIKEGDLLMSRASGSKELIGSTAVVPALRRKLLLCDKVYRLKVDGGKILPKYVALVASSPQVRQQIEMGVSGAGGLANNLPSGVVRNLEIPLPGQEEQGEVVRAWERYQQRTADLKASLERQLALLAERRQALITAAVTGQFDVTTAGRAGEAVASV